MKKKLAAGGLVLAALALLAVGTLAYLVSEGRATNTITTGTVKIELHEYSVYDPQNQAEPVVYENPEGNLVPGDQVNKIPVITNTGTADCWVRLKVTLREKEEQTPAQRTAEAQPGLTDVIDMDYNEANWVQENGWYYYKTSLAPGAAAVPLFTKVSLSEGMNDYFQGMAFDIDLQAEAIQSKNNTLVGGNYAALWSNS